MGLTEWVWPLWLPGHLSAGRARLQSEPPRPSRTHAPFPKGRTFPPRSGGVGVVKRLFHESPCVDEKTAGTGLCVAAGTGCHMGLPPAAPTPGLQCGARRGDLMLG